MRRLNIRSSLLCVVSVYVKPSSMFAENAQILIPRRQRIRTGASQKLNNYTFSCDYAE
jgi:hypothetical protein